MNENIEERLQQIGEAALTESVVRLRWQETDEDSDETTSIRGSGFFIDSNLVVTNLHGVAGAPSLTVELVNSETEFSVEGVVAYDIENDLVILTVNGEGVPLPLNDNDTVENGEIVCVVGYPGGEGGQVTQVTIHGVRQSDKRIQIKEQLHPGQSGSPILNSSREVIGIAVGSSLEISVHSGRTNPSFSHAISVSTLAAMLASQGEVKPLVEWQKIPQIRGYTEGIDGQMKMMRGKYEEAMICFDAALNHNPDLVEIYNNRAGLKILMGKHEEAIGDCDAAIKLKPDLVESYINRASANLSLSNHDKAIADCELVLKLNPDVVQAYVIRATAKFTAKYDVEQHKEALADYDIAIKLNPNAVEIYYTRANMKLVLDDYKGAIEDFDKIISLSPEFSSSFNIYKSRADAKYSIKDYNGTIEDYSKIIELNPEDEMAYINRGRVKRMIGDYEGAIEDCDIAIQLKPNEHHAAYYNRGYSKRLLGPSKSQVDTLQLYIEAIDDYTEAIKLKPKHSSTHNNRGRAKFLYGRIISETGDPEIAAKFYQESLIDYTEAININKKNKTAFSNRGRANRRLGVTHVDKGEHDAARQYYSDSIDDYTEIIKLDSKNSVMYDGRGWSRYLLGLLESAEGNIETANNLFQAAIADSDEAIQLKQGKPRATYFYTRAVAKSGLEDYGSAIEDFSEAIRIKPKNAIHYRDRSKANAMLGNHEEAKADLAKAKELDPDVENKSF